MIEIFVLLAASTPTDIIIDELNTSVQKYMLAQTKDRKQEILMWCHIFILKEMSNRMEPAEIVRQMEQVKRIKERLETQNQ